MIDDVTQKEQETLDATIGNSKWRLEHLYKIADKHGKTVIFKPNRAQRDFSMRRTGRDIILKARQLGFSTYCLITYLDRVLWTENCWIAIIAHEKDALEKLFAKILFAWDNLDPDLKAVLPEPSYETRFELAFRATNSKIYVDLDVRGGTNQVVHFSEYARILEDRILATLPTVPESGEIVIETTPNGMGNRFYNEYLEACRGKNEYKAHFYPWWWDDEYRRSVKEVTDKNLTVDEKGLIEAHGLDHEQIEWRRITIAKNRRADGTDLFPQEYPEDDITCFITSGNAAFDTKILERIRTNLIKYPPVALRGYLVEQRGRIRFVESAGGPLLVYEAPQLDMEYVMGADSAEGGPKGDNSAAQILRRDNLMQVAVYKNKIDTGAFAEELAILGKYYKLAHICPERNTSGVAVINRLLEVYSNNHVYREIDLVAVFQKPGRKYGYHTNRRTKGALIGGEQNFLVDSDGQFLDLDTIEEMMQYQRDGSGFNAARGKHDDLIISHSLALEMHRTLPPFKPRLRRALGTWEKLLGDAKRRAPQVSHWMSY